MGSYQDAASIVPHRVPHPREVGRRKAREGHEFHSCRQSHNKTVPSGAEVSFFRQNNRVSPTCPRISRPPYFPSLAMERWLRRRGPGYHRSRYPPFENREGWGSLIINGADKNQRWASPRSPVGSTWESMLLMSLVLIQASLRGLLAIAIK